MENIEKNFEPKTYNIFDKVYIDINQKFKEQNLWLNTIHKFDKNSSTKKEYKIKLISKLFNLLKMYYMLVLLETGVLEKLVFSNLSTKWFNTFRDFWVGLLKNRPIDVFDFHFLYGSYRAKYGEIVQTNEENIKEFIEKWQAQWSVYRVFNSVWRYAKLAYLGFYPFFKYIPDNSSILEYGCGIAPITEGLIKYCSYKNLKFTIADIEQINFFYARWRLANKNYINFVTIDPAIKDNLPSGQKYNVIICITVFDFLVNPFEIVKILHQHLEEKGVLIFDYPKRDCIGLDTKKGQTERREVLDFIEKNFKILKGKINYNNSTNLTVAEKI